MPRRCEEALHWEQVVERSIQVGVARTLVATNDTLSREITS